MHMLGFRISLYTYLPTHGTDFVITSELFQEVQAISSCGTFRFLMYRLHFFITLSAPTILYIVILLQNITIILY